MSISMTWPFGPCAAPPPHPAATTSAAVKTIQVRSEVTAGIYPAATGDAPESGGRRAVDEAQAHAAARAEGDAGKQAHLRLRRRLEAESLRGAGQHQLRLHHREAVADADARAAAEREVGEARQPLLQIALPPFRPEGRRVVEDA